MNIGRCLFFGEYSRAIGDPNFFRVKLALLVVESIMQFVLYIISSFLFRPTELVRKVSRQFGKDAN